ncbi:MAG TPA: phosphate ABC transporter permease, partial [Clostridiales bacterium UBA8153]|nr:phosphate ABC transporter permease [Clostridiales bacterium UBA8153]
MCMAGAACLTVLVMLAIIGQILSRGLGQVNLYFLLESPRPMGREGGIFSTIVSTLYLTAFALSIAVPLSVGTAIYLTEYARPGKLV